MPADCTTLFVKNLPYDFAEDDVGDRFRQFGEIDSVRIAYNWQTKQSKGFAYVSFKKHTAAKTALEKMHGKEVLGRALHVDFDSAKAKASYKQTDETERNKIYNKEANRDTRKKLIRKENEKRRAKLLRN